MEGRSANESTTLALTDALTACQPSLRRLRLIFMDSQFFAHVTGDEIADDSDPSEPLQIGMNAQPEGSFDPNDIG